MLGGAAGGPAAAMQPRPPDQFPPTAGARGAQVAPRPRWRTGVLRPTTTDDILLHRSVSASARPLFPFGLAGAADDAVASMGGGCRRRPALTGRLAAMVGLENQRHRNLHLGAGVAASVTWSSSYSLGGGPTNKPRCGLAAYAGRRVGGRRGAAGRRVGGCNGSRGVGPSVVRGRGGGL